MNKKHFVITVERQYGSGGRLTGKRLAEELGIHFYDEEILKMTSETSAIGEQYYRLADEKAGNKLLYRIVTGMKPDLGEPVRDGDNITSPENLFRFQSSVIRKLAGQESCIIVGRCADKILEETEGLISLFIYAPMEARVKEIMRRYETDEKEAEYLIKQADKIRKNYYNFYAKKTWADKASYDMLIDSSRISEKELAAMLRALLTARGVELETDGSDQ